MARRAPPALLAALAWFALSLASRVALAAPPAAYTYELENAEATASAGRVVVLWPRSCHASGKPLGAIDRALNPDWAERMHEVDYEVVVAGKAHGLMEPCVATARLYALPAAEFPRATRTSTEDDRSIGQPEAGLAFAVLPALDAVDLTARVALFSEGARVLRAAYRFEAPRVDPRVVREVRDVLAVDDPGGAAFAVSPRRVLYTFADGATETLPYAGAVRPPPSRGSTDLDASAVARVASPADAAPPSPAADAGATAPAASPDRDTRFLYLAGVAGLLVGGLAAAYRKRRARERPPPP